MTVRLSGLASVLVLSAAGLMLGACVATPPPYQEPYRNDPPYQSGPVRNPPVYQAPVYRNDPPYQPAPSANDDRVIYQNPADDRPIRNDGAYRPQPGAGDRDFTDPGDGDGRPDDRRPTGNPPRDTRPDRDGNGSGGGDRGDDRRPPGDGRPDRNGNGGSDDGGDRGGDRAARPGDRNQGAIRREGGCDASAVGRFVGMKATASVLGEMRRVTGARAVRAGGPDTALTMDFSPDRLTVELDRQDRVVRAGCN